MFVTSMHAIVAPSFAPILAILGTFFAAFRFGGVRAGLQHRQDGGRQHRADDKECASLRNLFTHVDPPDALTARIRRSWKNPPHSDVDLDQRPPGPAHATVMPTGAAA
jgi:hypothetical protein